jgi:hypothetical protein
MSRTWALFERVAAPDVNNPAQDHMVRYRLVQTPWFGLYLHRLNTPDDARPIPHTHPWSFVSLVLRGGYTEDVERRDHTGRREMWWNTTWRTGTIHRLRATDAHKITKLRRSPTWTLLLVGPRRPEPAWGYWDRNRFTPWNEHPYSEEFMTAQAARATARTGLARHLGTRIGRVRRTRRPAAVPATGPGRSHPLITGPPNTQSTGTLRARSPRLWRPTAPRPGTSITTTRLTPGRGHQPVPRGPGSPRPST